MALTPAYHPKYELTTIPLFCFNIVTIIVTPFCSYQFAYPSKYVFPLSSTKDTGIVDRAHWRHFSTAPDDYISLSIIISSAFVKDILQYFRLHR